MRKLTESMETVLEYIATGTPPVDMARMESRSYALSFQGLERRGLVESSPNGGSLTDEGCTYWAKKNGEPVRGVVDTETVGLTAEEITVVVVHGDKVVRNGLKGKVLEVATRAGVMLAAVAFGFDLVWVKVAELVTL